MFRQKIVYFLIVAILIGGCSVSAKADNTTTTYSSAIPSGELKTAVVVKTVIPTSTATLLPTITRSPTKIPTTTQTPIPTAIPAKFEFDFQPGFIPAELETLGVSGVELGIAKSSGGKIDTAGMKNARIVPLAKGGYILNAVAGNVTFLPFPEKMLTESGQELTYSERLSGEGWVAYVGSNGRLARKMVVQLPTQGTIVSGVSFNPNDRGAVYAVRLGAKGEILGKAPLVFDSRTTLSVVFQAEQVAIEVNDQPSAPDYDLEKWEVDVLRELEGKLADKGVFFSPDTTNEIDLGYGKYTMHFSQGILKRSGLKYIRFHPQVMENFFLQAMGEFMYFNRDYYPDVYNDFFAFQLSVYHYPEDEFLLRKLARKILNEGPAPLKFTVGNMQGSVNEIDMFLVSKAEFVNSILPEMDSIHAYITNLGWFVPEKDFNLVAFIDGNKLVVVAYDLGRPDERKQSFDSLLEVLYYDPEKLYWGIFKTWKDVVALLHVGMAPDAMKYDAHRGYGRDKYIICLGADANAGKTGKCLPYVRYAFTKGLPIPATPSP